MTSSPKIAFDLDETLGIPLVEGSSMVGWQLRSGCQDLLDRLRSRYSLCIWTVSSRRYLDKALSFGLSTWFSESYSWDELPCQWKDIRRIHASFLVDDSPHHREAAAEYELENGYIVVLAYGSPEDLADPLAWVRLVESRLTPVLAEYSDCSKALP